MIAPPLDKGRFADARLGGRSARTSSLPRRVRSRTATSTTFAASSASQIALFTLVTATPAGLGLVVGGKLADIRGRRRLIAAHHPRSRRCLILVSFMVAGAPMWFAAFGGGFIGGIAYPALAVYRAELFPTGNRGRAAGMLTASALLGGIGGLLLVGRLLDRGASYGRRDRSRRARSGGGGRRRAPQVPGDGPPHAGGTQPRGRTRPDRHHPTPPVVHVVGMSGATTARVRGSRRRHRRWCGRCPSGRAPCPRRTGAAPSLAAAGSPSTPATRRANRTCPRSPEMNSVGTSMSGKCSTRSRSALPGGWSG